jgi:murein DD-endopeptidase MepM/ murein hydrolase activator NlpD
VTGEGTQNRRVAKREDGLANCGWTRLTYLLFALTILIALAQVGGPSADPRTLATKTPGGATVEVAPIAEGGPSETAPTVQPGGSAHTASAGHDAGDHRSVAVVGDARGAAGPDPRVFYRPVPASPTPGGEPAPDPACADLGAFSSDRRIAFPLPRKYLDSYENTWGAPRPQGGHEGTDLMAPTGTAAYAVTDGTIVAVAGANENGWNSLGGYAVMLKAAYSVGPIEQGDLFYYAHLNHESELEIGTTVSVGQTVGYVGDTGQGPEVTRGLFPPHLHLGWYGAGSAVTSGAMNPYPLLEWLRANGGAITGGSDARYCEAPRTGGPVPATGEGRWPAPESPGLTPDLATGANRPAPGPAAAVPERETGHTGGAAPAQQRESAPDQSPTEKPGGAEPKTAPQAAEPSAAQQPSSRAPDPPAPHAGPPPETSNGESAGDPADAPTSGAGPEGDEAKDPPDEEQNPGEDTPGEDGEDGAEAPEEEPETEEPEEDSQPAGEQTSPGEDQYAPETDGESDPETTTAAG